MSSRLSSAILALAAAILLLISIGGSGWWTGHPYSPTRTYTQIAHVGLHGAKLCMVDQADLETCKDAPTHSIFGAVGYLELIACLLLLLSTIGLAVLSLQRKEERKLFGLLVLGGAALGDVLAFALMAIGPTSEATIPFGYGLWCFFLGSTSGLVGALLARRDEAPVTAVTPIVYVPPPPISQQQVAYDFAPMIAASLPAPQHSPLFQSAPAPSPPRPPTRPPMPAPVRAESPRPTTIPPPFSRPLPKPMTQPPPIAPAKLKPLFGAMVKPLTQPPPFAQKALYNTKPIPKQEAEPTDTDQAPVVVPDAVPDVGDTTDVNVPVVDEDGSAGLGSRAEGRGGVIDEDGSAGLGSRAEGRGGVIDEDGSAGLGSRAEGRGGVIDMPTRDSATDIATIAVEKFSHTELEVKVPISTAPAELPPPADVKPGGPSPACPQCEAPMAWVEEHLRFYCKSCRMYF